MDASPNGVEPDRIAAPTAVSENYADAELARAVTLGFGEYREDDPVITYAEFFKMLDRTVELADKEKLEEWQSIPELSSARNSTGEMTRSDGMFSVLCAAESLGEEYAFSNNTNKGILWEQLGNWEGKTGQEYQPNEKIFPHSMQSGTPAVLFNPQDDYEDRRGDAIMYSFGRMSLYSNKILFDYDEVNNTMRATDPFLYTEALLAALRLYESELPPESPRVPTELDREILAKADARREAIRNSPTTVSVTGKKYYVSNDGSDKNDGLSPETAWATLDKVNNFKFRPGDGVFLKRGDIWRFQMFDAQEGVTYSAYGEGEKPRIYGSPENGAGEEKWSLVQGTNNIWVYYRNMRDCGAIVFNEGESYAQKEYLYWDGKKHVTFTSLSDTDNTIGTSEFKPEDLNDMRFYNAINYAGIAVKHIVSSQDDVYVSMPKNYNSKEGKLYLRCDRGNPGLIYDSIEFCVDRSDTHEFTIGVYTTGVTIDNLCLKYAPHAINLGIPTTMQYDTKNFSKGDLNIIQNCEIGWAAGTTERFLSTGITVYSGDGMHIEGSNNLVVNNYVYESQDGGIPSEVSPTYLDFGNDWSEMEISWENLMFKGNLVERCNSGLMVFNWEIPEIPGHMFSNIVIEDNIVMYSGYGHSGKRDKELWLKPNQGRVEPDHAWGHALDFFGSFGLPNANDGIYVRDNVFYLSTSSLISSSMPQQYYPKFSGNTYVQNNYGRFAFWREPDGREVFVNMARPDIEEYVKTMLGDDTAIIASVSTGAPTP